MLELEEDGKLNMTVRLKKRALQGAYDQAIKKKKVSKHSHSIAVPRLMEQSHQALLGLLRKILLKTSRLRYSSCAQILHGNCLRMLLE